MPSSYKHASKAALLRYGTGHLSKSSASNMAECYNKWYLGKFYSTPNVKMSGGQVFHSLKETVQKKIMNLAVEGVTITDIPMYAERYAEAKDTVLAKVDIPDMLKKAAMDEYESVLNSPNEVLTDLRQFKSELLEVVAKITDNFTLGHLAQLVANPALAVEDVVTWIDTESGVPDAPPYLGYLDELWFDQENDCYVVSDLKSHFKVPTVSGPIGADTLFQGWLYAKSLVQMERIPADRRIVFEAKRVVCKFGKKKSEIMVYNHFLTKNGELLNLNDPELDKKMYARIRSTAAKIQYDVRDYAGSTYGCGSCEYKKVCDKAVIPEWSDQKGDEEVSE